MERMLRGNPNETIISSQIPFAQLLDRDVQRFVFAAFFFFFFDVESASSSFNMELVSCS